MWIYIIHSLFRWKKVIELANAENTRLEQLLSTHNEFCESLQPLLAWIREHVTDYVTQKHSIDTKLELEAQQARFDVRISMLEPTKVQRIFHLNAMFLQNLSEEISKQRETYEKLKKNAGVLSESFEGNLKKEIDENTEKVCVFMQH